MNKEQFIKLLKPHSYRYISSDDPLTLDSITKVSFSGNELYNFCKQYADFQTESLKKEIEELKKEITQLKCLHLEFYNGEDNLLRCRYCEKIANEI